jgi:RNA polymerase sigma factor (sigma-70 family)
MATNQLSHVIQTLDRAILQQEGEGLSDGQLLERYIRSREESAFAALVRRHGPMVWGVCRRVLRSREDAEDAFQATFLVLVRKASVVPKELVVNWLYGVAHRTAMKARAIAAKRQAREKQVMTMPEPTLAPPDLWNDLQPVLDQELSCLPGKYRAIIALCDLEGKSRKDASRNLHLPEGTVASRLATARALLAKRLARHGLVVSGPALAAAVSQEASSASVPLSVVSSTIKAASAFAAGQVAAGGILSAKAVALAEGVLKAMLLTKLKITGAVLTAFAVLGTGAAALTLAEKTPNRNGAQTLLSTTPENPAEKAVDPPAPGKKEQATKPVVEKEERPTLVRGIATAVDPGKSILTVDHRDGETTFTVPKDAKIEIDGKPGALAGVPRGASVNLSQFVDANTAAVIRAEGGWFWGTVKAVDVQANTISYGDKAQSGSEGRTFVVTKDTLLSIDGKPGTLAEIPVGSSANIQVCVDQQTARSLAAEGTQINGQVKAVDAAVRTVTVNEATYPVAPDAHIAIDHKPGKLEDLPAGANVGLNLKVDQKTVLRISANGSSDFGQVKAVDAANNTITVTGGPPNDRVYNVPPDAPITIDGQPSSLAAIPVGAGLHALNLRVDQKTVSSINVVGHGYHRVGVTAVDAGNRTVTFDDKAPATIAGKTLAVAPEAGIEIDGKPGRLAGIPAGAFLNVRLSVDAQRLLHVQAEGPTLGGCGGSEVSVIDAVNNTITFADKGPAEVAGKTFRVAKEFWLQMDAKPGKLGELPTGSYLNITLAVDQQTVRSIWAVGPPVPGFGVVKAVDMQKSTITVDDRTYPVAKNANIVMGNRGGLAEIPIGATVALRFCVDQKTLGTIAVQAK